MLLNLEGLIDYKKNSMEPNFASSLQGLLESSILCLISYDAHTHLFV